MLNLGWKPDRMSSIPLYLQIKEFIKEKIENGEWTTGSKVPPQRALADALGVNRSTVVLAFDELTDEALGPSPRRVRDPNRGHHPAEAPAKGIFAVYHSLFS